ncbi:MAG: hypothetical protein HZB75_01210 [Candidatus Saccharibacteria bacterium]|nr:MAG: hypothetical protein HZB75_01210 [Candidatus Saccharibacteria bacterium]
MNITTLLAQSYSYDADYYYNTSANLTPAEQTAVAGAILFFIVFMLFAVVITYVISSLLLSRIFKKAGVETWKAWVPVYNNWVLLEMGEQKGYWAVIALIPVVNIIAAVFMIIAMYNVGLKFGKEGAFVLLAIFLPIVWLIWLAVDDSKWKGKKPAKTPTEKTA